MLENFVKGVCEEFCPKQEVQLRKRENMVHFFERDGIFIKEFTRSAAGTKHLSKFELRTPGTLIDCVQYLLTEILLDGRKPFNVKYDFIFDRLRAIRQEIVIQNLPPITTISLLEPIIMFLSYSHYYLCEADYENFDPKICRQHLNECFLKTLCCYDDLDRQKQSDFYSQTHRIMIESLYIVSNLGETDTLNRALLLPSEIKSASLMRTCLKLSIDFFTNNMYQVLNAIKRLPPIVAAVVSLKLPAIRRIMLERFSSAFNHKILTVPMDWLQTLMLYQSPSLLMSDLKYFNIETNNEQRVKFDRTSFDSRKLITKSTRLIFLDNKLSNYYLPDLIFLKDL